MTSKTSYFIAFGFAVAAFILCSISLGTGYWWVSIDPENLFQSIGLWQACFNGYEHTSDLVGKPYYGCWWLFYKEYYYIRNWLMPPWFKACQTLATFGIVFQFFTLVLMPFAGIERSHVKVIMVTCFTCWMMFFCQCITVVIFGVMIGEDRTWMPGYHQDRLGWSYGLAVICGFFSIFSAISLMVYLSMRKYDIINHRSEPVKRLPKI